MERHVRRLRRGLGGGWLLISGAGLVSACEGIIGIQDLTVEPRPLEGAGGVGGSSGASAAGTGGGGAGSGGSAAGSANVAGDDAGARPPPSPSSPLADGGAPDAGSERGLVVTGRVIDFFRRPVPDTAVTIGATTAVTNAQGQFSIAGVDAPYTASLMVNMIRNGSPARYGYVYEGLTRNDPTLQVYAALPQHGAPSLTVTFDNVVADPLRYLILGWSSPDGRFIDAETTTPTEFVGSPSWTGPATTTGTIHALLAFRDVAGEPPVAFEAYQGLPLTVSDGQPASVAFDLASSGNLPTGIVEGSVTGGQLDSRANYVAVRFEDGTTLPIVAETPDLPDFSYFVPNLAGASFVVAAANGSSGFAPYAVTHRQNVASGQSDLALAVPNPVSLSSPQLGATVTPSTGYAWSVLTQTAETFLWHLEFDATYEGMFVLTTRSQIELPQFADGFTLPPGVSATWSVETHGNAASVDALTGPDGYLDAFSLGTEYPVGPNRSDGYYTESERRAFTMSSD